MRRKITVYNSSLLGGELEITGCAVKVTNIPYSLNVIPKQL